MANTPPGSAIYVRTRYQPLAFILGLCHPRLTLDGGPPVVGNWGETTIPVPAGQHTVRCWFRYLYLSEAGDSSVTVDVAPGQVVSVTYVAPWLVFLAGKWSVGDGALAVGPGGSAGPGLGAATPYPAMESPDASNPYGQQPYESNPGLQAQAASGPEGGSGDARETVVFAPGPFQQPRSSTPTEAATAASAAPAGWLADPVGRHQLRYWDGREWTEHVSDGGVSGVDAL